MHKDIPITPSQRTIITHPTHRDRTLRIVSGPGAGKSTTLVYKLAQLHNEGFPLERVLVLSMTNRAVDSVRTKLAEVLGVEGDHVAVHTFHSLSHSLLDDDEWFHDAEVLDEPGWKVLSELVKLNKYRLKDCITKVKAGGGGEEVLQKVCREYGIKVGHMTEVLELMRRMHTIIHSDVLRAAKEKLRQGLELGYEIVIVDEFQDMYLDLWEFVELVARDSHLIVAGDPCQSIYSFLGSNDVVEQRLEDFKPIDTVEMNESFRSTPEIIAASDALLHEKRNLTSLRPHSTKPVLTITPTYDEQFQFIADEILRLQLTSQSQIRFRDILVLARTNAQLERLGKTMSIYRIPHLKLSSTPAWLDNELSNLMNYLSVLYKPDKAHWSVVCTLKLLPGVGPVMVTRLEKAATAQGLSLYDYLLQQRDELKLDSLKQYVQLMEETRQQVDFHDTRSIMTALLHVGNELGLRKTVAKRVKTQMDKNHLTRQLLDFYENLKMFASMKPEEMSVAEYFLQNYMDRAPLTRLKDAVRVSTIHSAKGLEFPVVFMMCGDRLSRDEYEERKLHYVGMTRAQSLLYLNLVQEPDLLVQNEKLYKQKYGHLFQFEAPDIDEQLVNVVTGKTQFVDKRPSGVRHFHTLIRPRTLRTGISLFRKIVH